MKRGRGDGHGLEPAELTLTADHGREDPATTAVRHEFYGGGERK
jgi:hypothetical protein